MSAINGLLQLGCNRDEVVNIITAAGMPCPSWLVNNFNVRELYIYEYI